MTPRLRGSLLLDQIALVEKDHGRAVVDAAIRKLQPEHREEIDGAVSISWVSVPASTALKVGIATELGLEPMEFQRQLVYRALDATMNTVWRVLLRAVSDHALMARTPILYSKAFDHGKMALRSLEQGSAKLVLTGWPDIPEYNAVGLCAGIEALLEYAGRKKVVVTWNAEAPLVHFTARWTGR